MKCPHQEKHKCNRKLEPILAGVSFKCVKPACSDEPYIEFYKVVGGALLTAAEFRKLKIEMDG